MVRSRVRLEWVWGGACLCLVGIGEFGAWLVELKFLVGGLVFSFDGGGFAGSWVFGE